MKTVTMSRDFDYRPKAGVVIAYRGGRTYERVPELAAKAIRDAGAGQFVASDAKRADH
jgi:hypothetical protein